jgi:ribosomal protein L12E/L44/L45/RPP1/RPP2
LPRNAADRDAELNWLKTLVKQLADKVNAPGDTPAARIAAVEDRVDEVALHGVLLGTTLGLAAMATTPASTTPRSRAASMAAHQKTSMTSRSSWSASTATTTPLPTPSIPNLC